SIGFDAVLVTKPQLDNQVKMVLPPGDKRVRHWASVVLYITGLVLLAFSSYSEPILGSGAVAVAMISLLLVAILQIPGWLFRSRIDWGLKAAVFLLIPASVVSLGTAVFLWWYPGVGEVDLPWTMLGALTVLALEISNASINGMKSRQSSEAIAFRKRLARGRSFFLKELEKPRPNLRDGWYPWLLAFGLGKQVDVWSSRRTSTTTSASTSDHSTSSSSSSSSSTGTGWSGGGGLSGGAGASGAWAAAAAGRGGEGAGCRAAEVQAGPRLRLRRAWRLESQLRVRAAALVEVRAVPVEDRPVEAEDGKKVGKPNF